MSAQPERFPDVGELVPHVAPMLALAQVVAWEPGRVRAIACLHADHYLMHRGYADACVAIELITQTVAACLGMAAFRRGEPVHVGMVVACRRLELPRGRIESGERLTIDVHCVRSTEGVGIFDGEAHDAAGALVARGSFTLVYGEQFEGNPAIAGSTSD